MVKQLLITIKHHPLPAAHPQVTHITYTPSVHMVKTIHIQARSQDQFWGVQDPQKVNFFEPHPPYPYPPTKTPFLAHFVAKSGPFGRLGGGCVAPPAPPWLWACPHFQASVSFRLLFTDLPLFLASTSTINHIIKSQGYSIITDQNEQSPSTQPICDPYSPVFLFLAGPNSIKFRWVNCKHLNSWCSIPFTPR